jgi:two-component system chemotaxis response regulator CheB
MRYSAVVIGVSAGGMEALHAVLSVLPPDFPVPVIVVQHMAPHSDDFLAQYLNDRCQPHVKEADEKETMRPGVVYLAPANYHLLVEDDKTLSLAVTKRINYARPAIDVLFESAADAFGPELIGIVLTGANDDGSRGLKKIKDQGGLVIVQDPEEAVADIMPRAAIAATAVDHILPLEAIGHFLCKVTGVHDG